MTCCNETVIELKIHNDFSLEEKGQTALGPALLLSVLLAGKVPGSKVCSSACADTFKLITLSTTDNRSSSAQMDWLTEELEVWMVSIVRST